MKLSLIGNDIDLQLALQETGHFEECDVYDVLEEGIEYDVLVISSKVIDPNHLSSYFNERSMEKKKIKPLFYILHEVENETIFNNISSICKTRKISLIPPLSTPKQVAEKIIKELFPELGYKNRNVITFFGADNKIGTTMIGLCAAQKFASQSRAKVMYISLGDTPVMNFIKGKDHESIGLDELKVKLFNRMLSPDELLDACIKVGPLHILQGPKYIPDLRHYHPDHLEILLDLATKIVDLVIIDAGSNIERGMTIGALRSTKFRYLITTQQEIPRKQFDRVESQILRNLDIKVQDFLIVINKYIEEVSMYNDSKLADIYKMTLATAIPNLEYMGWQAEFENQSLLHYNNQAFVNKIDDLCKIIASQTNLDYSSNTPVKKPLIGNLIAGIMGV
ncbi:hypothetical protein ACFQ88_38960 [Paenibacillus sp. NPDC056579]|uniref:hypothetical protein n=1 Tax=Paenibacillus sp. NPDC056579 TaxID=3345871 RepID=UPI0036748D90